MAGGVTAQTDRVDALVTPLRSAGGVVVRPHPEHGVEVALVHRPRFDDWSLPKGKLKRAEHPLEAAVREVREETGALAVVGARLPTVGYDVWTADRLREKLVDYWVMTVTGTDGWQAGREVDDVVWLPVPAALKRLTYPHDRKVLRAYAELPALDRPELLLRHASAGDRSGWDGDDMLRPLDPIGTEQAGALTRLMALFGVTTLVSADPQRCQQTLAPLAEALELVVGLDSRFNEDASPALAADAVRGLSNPHGAVVVCSQGNLIPQVMAELTGQAPGRYRTAKAEGWSLCLAEQRLVTVDALSTEA